MALTRDRNFPRAFRRFASRGVTLPRAAKRAIMILVDVIALPLCGWLTMFIVIPSASVDHVWLAFAPLLVAVPAQILFKFYRSVVRFMGFELIVAAMKCTSLTAVIVTPLFALVTDWPSALRVGSVYWLLSLVYLIGSRVTARTLLQSVRTGGDRALIYGAGESGANLAASLKNRGEIAIVGFVDDNLGLTGSMINGVEVYSPSHIPRLIADCGISRVLLALPRASRRRRQEILTGLEPLAVHVQTVPDFVDIISGNARVDDIREVEIKDLLGRDTVPPDPDLLEACVSGKPVMVTGAGGSIGSELCMQIVRLRPQSLVLLEISEAALYVIHQRIEELVRRERIRTKIYPLIGSVHHKKRMEDVLRTYKVETVYHAAAYKHVPLVEHNMIEGIHNNVFGTLHAAEAAIAAGVKSFVLVSTDKAVKPPNVMGATKRMAELILQALDVGQHRTTFSMVRFGNVLASSGSVVPLFREQIRAGGPVTVTHPEIYRYFMTIPEAAALVIQAGSMARGGDVFVLDMGESVRIRDLAERMIHLMGLTVKDKANPDGDIEIQYTGLRPAEKLYEELLIGDNVMGTEHPSIMRAEEESVPLERLEDRLKELWHACQRLDCVTARNVLIDVVTGYEPGDALSDLVWQERNRGRDTRRPPFRESNVRSIEVVRASLGRIER